MGKNRQPLASAWIIRGDIMTMQYAITGGQLYLDKIIFAKEILMLEGSLKRLISTGEEDDKIPPKIERSGQTVSINYNDASDILLDENFYDLLKKLKAKYKEKITGRVVIRITALTSYHVILDLNTQDGRIMYE